MRCLFLWPVVLCALLDSPAAAQPAATILRIATFDVDGLRTRDLADAAQPRVRRLGEGIQRVRPNIILLTGMAYDAPVFPDVPDGRAAGRNAQVFAEHFLATAQATDTEPLRFRAFMAPVNSGLHSGFDLDHDGAVTDTYPPVPGALADGSAPAPTDEGRAFSRDAW